MKLACVQVGIVAAVVFSLYAELAHGINEPLITSELHARGRSGAILPKAIRVFSLPDTSTWSDVLSYVHLNPHALHAQDGFKQWERNYLRRRPAALREVNAYNHVKRGGDAEKAAHMVEKMQRRERRKAETVRRNQEEKRKRALLAFEKKNKRGKAVKDKQTASPLGTADFLSRWNAEKRFGNDGASSSNAPAIRLPLQAELPHYFPASSDVRLEISTSINAEEAASLQQLEKQSQAETSLGNVDPPRAKRVKMRLFGAEFDASSV